ncbi:unnamed protein product [Discosporangium mesarthrocarpum]
MEAGSERSLRPEMLVDEPYERPIGVVKGKITRAVLERALGKEVMENVRTYMSNGKAIPAGAVNIPSRSDVHDSQSISEATKPGFIVETKKRWTGPLFNSSGTATLVRERGAKEAVATTVAEKLGGTQDTPGHLQVVVSGPVGFVYNVEMVMLNIGIPLKAMVLLD